jgi:hypothetical protein
MNAHTHDCQRFEALLPGYLEGELDTAAASAAERGAQGCLHCSTLMADLAAIRAAASSLPVLEPGRDLWDGIAERIAPDVVSIAGRGRAAATPEHRPRRQAHPAWLAAAAVVLVILTATVTWSVAGGGRGEHTVNSAGPGVTTAGSFFVASVEAPYRDQITMLREMLDERQSELDSSTVAVIERNLTIIEAAVAESRAALARDTTSRFLREQLDGALERKVDLLRTAALLPASRS